MLVDHAAPIAQVSAGSICAPLEHQFTVVVLFCQQVGKAAPIALFVDRDACVVAAGRAAGTRDRASLAAPPGRQEVACGAVHRALSLIQCSSLRYDHPTEVRSGLTHFDHRCPATGGTRLGPRWRLLSRARDAARSERVGRSGPGNRTLHPWQPGSSLPGVGLQLGALFSSASAVSACD